MRKYAIIIESKIDTIGDERFHHPQEVFYEDSIERVKKHLAYIAVNYPGRAFCVYKQINVAEEMSKAGFSAKSGE